MRHMECCYLFYTLLFFCEIAALVKFTNINCTDLDRPFAHFRHCRLKLLSRGIVGLNVHVELYQLPVNNVSLNLSLSKKANGFRPFLYNYTVNFCEFMAHRKRNPFLNIVFNFIERSSNINQTCPYNHDIIVKNLVLRDDDFRLLPLPYGDYLLKLKVGAYNIWRADVMAYLTICEIAALVKFTNVNCTDLDKSFAHFRHCRLKLLSRGIVGLNLHVELYQLPVNNVSLNLSLSKKANGFRPFLYNYTVNFCEFMAHRKRNPFLNIVFSLLDRSSNINHTCPYNHDIIVKDLVLRDDDFRLMPLPIGDYLFKLKVGAFNIWRADVMAYINML